MIVNSILELFLMILSMFLIVLKIKYTWITFLYYHQLILWNDLAMYYKKKCRKSINFIVQLNLNLWNTIWIDNMMKTKRRNLVQKNLKYTLGSFYFVGNKFLDCQLFNDVISLFHLCAPFKKTWNFLGVLMPVWELPTKLSLNSNDCIVFKLENLTPAYCYAWMMSTDHFFYRSTIYNELCQHSRSMVLQRLLSFQFLKWMISQNIIMKCTRVILRPQSNLYTYKVINASGFGRYLFILCTVDLVY